MHCSVCEATTHNSRFHKKDKDPQASQAIGSQAPQASQAIGSQAPQAFQAIGSQVPQALGI
ncbi:unnamed protein product [Arabis nemorensis]|uniref:Uncharacterized protein n=1 Tax=Arabis nemorensis TaxID=586526 RepID=A0A565BJ11_9BRAS|nr:unnamed protein product [Arabis nemorensis]